MAFFKFRARGQKGEEQSRSPAETIDDMRRRARHRLIGATVLVLIGVLGFPLLFDTQPRPVQVDIPIEIPDRDKTRLPGAGGKISAAEPATTPAAPSPPPVAASPAPAPEKVSANASLAAKEEVVAEKPARPAAAKEEKQEKHAAPAPAAAEAKAEHKVERKVEAKAPASADEGAKARALLEGKPAVAEGQERFVLQVGAFADADKAREARTRLERAGLKTYTQEVDTKDGKRIRVRVGPYTQRAEADKAAAQIKSLSLPVSVLTL